MCDKNAKYLFGINFSYRINNNGDLICHYIIDSQKNYVVDTTNQKSEKQNAK